MYRFKFKKIFFFSEKQKQKKMEFDFEYIIQNYLKYEDHLNKFQDETVVILLGTTGCGKSSLINYLLGTKMIKEKKKSCASKPK